MAQQKPTRTFRHPKTGKLVTTPVTVCQTVWAKGASRQVHGRKRNASQRFPVCHK